MKSCNIHTICLSIALLFFIKSGLSQVPVALEPHHKIIFQNRYVRVLLGVIPVHDTTHAHLHETNSVIVFLTPSQ